MFLFLDPKEFNVQFILAPHIFMKLYINIRGINLDFICLLGGGKCSKFIDQIMSVSHNELKF